MTAPLGYPQPARKGMPVWGWLLIAGGLCLILCCGGFVAFGILGTAAGHLSDGAADVNITRCDTDPGTGWPKAVLDIQNSDDHPHDYYVNVAFETAGLQVGTGWALVSDLAAGQTASEDAVALGKKGSGFTCRITDVSRT